jgi:pectate lyase
MHFVWSDDRHVSRRPRAAIRTRNHQSLKIFPIFLLAGIASSSTFACLGSGSGTGSPDPQGTGGAPLGTGGARSGSGGASQATGGKTGSGATAGSRGSAGAIGAGGATAPVSCTWPIAVGTNQPLTQTMNVSGVFDGGMQRFVGSGALGTSGQLENQPPLFKLSNGATLQNVILGNPAADGVHCSGSCTLKNVWWEDVGEDAATLEGSSDTQTMTIDGGGANHAADKVFQHNGPGTMVIRNFCVQDFGKLYRSCGNCSKQYARHVQIINLLAIPSGATSALAGVNSNYNDTASFNSIAIKARPSSIAICQRYTGNDTGAEPTTSGAGADGTFCVYAASDITWQ